MPRFRSALLPLLLLAAPLAAQEAAQPLPPRTIQVVGEGRALAAPDLARISLGVSHQAATAGEAMDVMSEGMSSVFAVLAEAGVAPADIQTGQLMLETAYNYNTPDGNPVMTGFIGTQIVDVSVRDLGRVGEILDAVVQGGANRVNGIYFDVAEPREVNDGARRAAVEDARARAELYAEAAGLTLGEILSISESTVFTPPMPLYDQAAGAGRDAASVPVAPGQVSMMTNVTVTYAVE